MLIGALFMALVWFLQPQCRKMFMGLLAPTLVGLALFAPWGVYGFWHQLHGDLSPGSAQGGLRTLPDGFAHMFHWNASLGGDWIVFWIAIPGTLLASIATLLGCLRLLKNLRSKGPEGIYSLMLLVFGLGLPLFGWVVSRVSERSTFGWRYLAGAAIAVQIIATIGLAGSSKWRRALGAGLFLTMSSITLINVRSGGHEDHRRVFEHIMAHGRASDAVLDKSPYDPIPLAAESSWRYYVNRFNQASNRSLPEEFSYQEINQAKQKDRVWVWFRDQYHPWVCRTLRRSHDLEERWQMGPALTLHLFSKSATR
jgi:hypothetical protein